MACETPELRKAFESHLEETKGQVERIERIFEGLDKKPGGMKCKGMEGLLEESEELIQDDPDAAAVLEAGLISSAQRVEHYEIAAYGTAVEWAKVLGRSEAARLLQKTLAEEYQANEGLTRLAAKGINEAAAAGREEAALA
ncbi:MAG TPA: DUF892 family protein [Gemmatimonadota bacterium]|nr:DUF892 family protein [Gemmatimonadota bacterium]